jgi:predicted 3-demethylubiquinone-9 3-methyltransferase (glyoxalase superfamily)
MEAKLKLNKIVTSLWFDKNAEEAVNFYSTIFKNFKVGRKMYYGSEGQEIHGMPEGTLLTIEFEIEGQQFIGLNGGPIFKFSEAISFIINCDTQDEIDYYWYNLGDGNPETQQCGWMKDKFGVSWQVVPLKLDDMIADPDKTKADRAMRAMLQMKKLDIAKLEAAFEGRE